MTEYLDNEFHLDLTGEGKCDALDCGKDATMLFEMLNTNLPSELEGKISIAEYCLGHGVQAHLNVQSFRYLRQIDPDHKHEYVDSNDPGQPETNVQICIHCGQEQI